MSTTRKPQTPAAAVNPAALVTDEPERAVQKFKVIGPWPVHGVKPGGTLTADPAVITVEQLELLITSGHIEPADAGPEERA
jgi:hypothetical protein